VAAALLLELPSPARAEMAPRDRQRLAAHLEMTSAWIDDELSGLSQAQLEFRRQPGTWSILEVLEHLAIVGDIYWRDLQNALRTSPVERGSAFTDADILWYGVDRTNRELAIPSEDAPGRLKDVRAGLETYRRNASRLLEYVRTTKDDLRRHLVARQRCDAWQWALLISTHEQRHVLQIREIKSDPKYPK
jgi:hypothetical protein